MERNENRQDVSGDRNGNPLFVVCSSELPARVLDTVFRCKRRLETTDDGSYLWYRIGERAAELERLSEEGDAEEEGFETTELDEVREADQWFCGLQVDGKCPSWGSIVVVMHS